MSGFRKPGLLASAGVAIIAEVKKASPSAGILRQDFDPVAIARTYAAHGASCISVLTDAPFFQGNFEYLAAIRRAVNLPLLRARTFSSIGISCSEAHSRAADAILLIAEILSPTQLQNSGPGYGSRSAMWRPS